MSSQPLASVAVVPGGNLFGHAHLLKRDRLGFLRSLGRVGPLARARFMHRTVLFANTPEVVHELLVERAASFEKSPGIRVLLRPLAGDGLFTSEGGLWRQQRKLMSPLFHASQLSSYTALMNSEARRALSRFSDGQAVDLAHELTRIAMGVVGATLFGADTFVKADEIGNALTTLLGWANAQAASNQLTLQVSLIEATEYLRDKTPQLFHGLYNRAEKALRDPVLLPGLHAPAIEQALKVVDDYVNRMIRERREHPTARNDLLSRLLLARSGESNTAADGMSDKQLRDEANTLFVAGHETTATALAWSFYLLAHDEKARARVQAEADAFSADGPGQPEPQRLAYTTRVFKEALRLYPPVVILARRSLEPVELAGVKLPSRTIVFASPYTIHLLPEVWPDPDRFDPDRFLPEREAGRHRSAWLPFGIGPRVCIGNHFALLEGPIVLATLMRRARFEIDPHRVSKPGPFLTLRPEGGVPARVYFQ